MRFTGTLLILLLSLCVTAHASGPDSAADDSLLPLTLSPERIEIGTFYRGADLKVTAEIPDCDGAVVLLTGDDREELLNRKGRVAGIWLNVAQVTVRNAPEVYILGATGDLKKITTPDVRRQLGLGDEYLHDRMEFTCDKPLSGSEFEEFMRLKERHGTYNMHASIGLAPEGPRDERLSAKLPVPATVPPGTYKVFLYCFDKGIPVAKGVATLRIEHFGLARFMSRLAHNRPASYGVLAIVVAMVVGIGMGVVFSGMRRAGH